MFEITQDGEGRFWWHVMPATQKEPFNSEAEAVESIKGWLKELGNYAVRDDFGGLQVKYKLRAWEEKIKQSKAPENDPNPDQGQVETQLPDYTLKDPGKQGDSPHGGAGSDNIGVGSVSSAD